MRVTAVVSVNLGTANMLLSVFFVSGVLGACPEYSSLFITAPKEMEALSESCLQIPCSFNTKLEGELSTTSAFGVWLKNDTRVSKGNVVFNSSSSINRYPLRIIGKLSEKNCTTLFSNLSQNHTNKYFFRIESSAVRATAFCDPVQITVKDSPPRPRIEISGEISGDLKEEQSVTITCSAVTPCPHSPPQLTWSLQQDARNNMEENADGTFTTKIQETITLSDQHDGNNITCSATYPVNEGKGVRRTQRRKTLSVLYPPKDTTVVISPSDPVSVGSMVNLTCSCRGNPHIVHFVWFMISTGRLELIKADTQVYGFRVTNGDRGRLFYCGCRNSVDIQLSTGRQLRFKGNRKELWVVMVQSSEIFKGDRDCCVTADQKSHLAGIEVIVKSLAIAMLVSSLVIFECWFRSKHAAKPIKVSY
uniref:sialic acid-binding Ig-like lectin 7 isoform X2 n=1 Tax=Scatophagus argus TaxID=75038 RepID=UPI001ED8049F|nr:sialic acid-binding Ig-like lectin 7 isoform X2 [Scatophagus argus]